MNITQNQPYGNNTYGANPSQPQQVAVLYNSAYTNSDMRTLSGTGVTNYPMSPNNPVSLVSFNFNTIPDLMSPSAEAFPQQLKQYPRQQNMSFNKAQIRPITPSRLATQWNQPQFPAFSQEMGGQVETVTKTTTTVQQTTRHPQQRPRQPLPIGKNAPQVRTQKSRERQEGEPDTQYGAPPLHPHSLSEEALLQKYRQHRTNGQDVTPGKRPTTKETWGRTVNSVKVTNAQQAQQPGGVPKRKSDIEIVPIETPVREFPQAPARVPHSASFEPSSRQKGKPATLLVPSSGSRIKTRTAEGPPSIFSPGRHTEVTNTTQLRMPRTESGMSDRMDAPPTPQVPLSITPKLNRHFPLLPSDPGWSVQAGSLKPGMVVEFVGNHSGYTNYPVWLTPGLKGVFLEETPGDPPISIQWPRGRTYWMHYADIQILENQGNARQIKAYAQTSQKSSSSRSKGPNGSRVQYHTPKVDGQDTLVVKNCGEVEAIGEYTLCGEFNGRPYYVKRGKKRHPQIFRAGDEVLGDWYLVVRGEKGPQYYVPNSKDAITPPQSGWLSARDAHTAKLPGPTIAYPTDHELTISHYNGIWVWCESQDISPHQNQVTVMLGKTISFQLPSAEYFLCDRNGRSIQLECWSPPAIGTHEIHVWKQKTWRKGQRPKQMFELNVISEQQRRANQGQASKSRTLV